MKKFWIILIIIVGLATVIVLATGRSVSPTSEVGSSNQVNDSNLDPAPNFTLKDYNGQTVSLADFDQAVIVVNAWATWCPFCVDELPDFAKLQDAFPGRIKVIAIDRQESLAKAKGFSDSLGLTDKLVFLLDPSDAFYKSIGGFAMPETIFINADREIGIHKRGPMTLSEMTEKVESILNSGS